MIRQKLSCKEFDKTFTRSINQTQSILTNDFYSPKLICSNSFHSFYLIVFADLLNVFLISLQFRIRAIGDCQSVISFRCRIYWKLFQGQECWEHADEQFVVL